MTYLLCTGIVVIVVVVAAVFACCKVHPVTGAPISGPFYEPGSTWDSTFGKLASPMEECRAECCGVYLCLEPSVLRVFGHAIEGAWGLSAVKGGWKVVGECVRFFTVEGLGGFGRRCTVGSSVCVPVL